ncbi:tumor necrosis factor ligand superfamily member 13B [Neolamprologus brichardi]|uniref:TNF superfamily member 13b n=1 Tax=Neolamprologus brichardi TaxID=32507 RepID=A0A3Q4MFK3_NEOBR|nr:tumor necrosis factor ligand superfamily member 13B [Neolamprologus brichardi]XP_039861606.1 tumor necrosis factor ligand superfamily member 13B [Simochromis diagramma]
MGPAMAVLAGLKPGSGQGDSERMLSWPVFLLMLAALSSSFLSALSLYQLVALRAEIEQLQSDVSCGREEGQPSADRLQVEIPNNIKDVARQPECPPAFIQTRRRRTVSGAEVLISQSFLQMLANDSRKNYVKEILRDTYTGIPWQPGLKRGTALEAEGDRILVREEGFYYVYSQVFYRDNTFAMGHVVFRWKTNVVGNEPQYVSLFRCIQNMNPVQSFNTCYTGGIVKLEAGDYLELLIPRATADVSLSGDSTFLGALKLA